MRSLRRHLLPLAILLLLPILMLLPALLPGNALLPAAMLGKMLPWKGMPIFPADPPFNPLQFDGIAQFYPWRLFAARTLHTGYLPLWNPYQFCGTPFLANDQSAILYPPNILFAIMPVAKAFGASAVLHLFLTGAFLYAFLRRRCSAQAALLGGIIWQLSAWQISWLALPTFLCTSAWIPLALLQIDRCVERPAAGRGVALGLILGVMLLAGHLQVALYGLMICFAYGLTLLFGEASDRTRAAWTFAAAGLLMLLICAPQILPSIELSRVSHRAGAQASIPGYSAYVALAMPWYRLVTLFAPSFFGRSADYWAGTLIPYSETACFVGIGGLMLAWSAICGLWGRANPAPERLRVRFFAVAAIAALLVALGTPLNALTYFTIPGFAATGSPARVLALWSLGMAVLAGYGLDFIRARGVPKAALRLTLASTLLPLVLAVLYVERINSDLLQRVDRVELVLSVIILIGVVLLAKVIATSGQRSSALVEYAAPALIALIAVDLFRAGFGFNPAADLAQVYPATPAIAWLQQHSGANRIVVLNAANGVYEQPGVLPPNAATVFSLRDLQGYDSLQTGRYKTYLNKLNGNAESSPPENGNMDLTHYEAVSSRDSVNLASAQWALSPVALGTIAPAASDPGVSVYAEPGFDMPRLRTVAAVSGNATPVDIIEDDPTRLTVRTRTAGDLVVADQWYPGWLARVNGREATILNRPEVFRTVEAVPAGATVTMTFEPPVFRLGLYLLDVALLLVALSAAFYVVGRQETQKRRAA